MTIPLRPIVTICGTTGVGKSKLAIDLALHMNRNSRKSGWRGAKVINADSMQVYKGLDVITNKVPESERQGIPHLLMGFKQPGEQYVVGEWVQETVKLIDEMHENQELPIIVGGTSYWIQHLIFPNRLTSKESTNAQTSMEVPMWPTTLINAINSLPPDLLLFFQDLPEEPPSAKMDPDLAFKLYTLLSKLDPIISQRWHWRDTRKVFRSLEIIRDSRRRPSDIIVEQSTAIANSEPRYRTLSFWLYAEPSVLGTRLDSRVDDMISQGLIDEVRCLQELASTNQLSDNQAPAASHVTDYTLGIYQSIGYREFCSHLKDPSDKTYSEAVERMKISTRQYAKRQISWIRNKLIPAVNAANVNSTVAPLYLLDATVLGNDWVKNVEIVATGVLNAFLNDGDLPDPKLLSETASRLLTVNKKDVDPALVLQARKKRVCFICTIEDDRPVMIEEGAEWDIHQKTRSHMALVAKRNRLENELKVHEPGIERDV